MIVPPVRTSISRRAAALAAVVALSLVLGACGSDKPKVHNPPTPAEVKETAKILNRGLSEQLAGNTDDAEDDFKEVLDRDPRNKFAFYNLGLIFQNEKKNEDAEEQYRLALGIDPKFEVALYNLAILRTLANDIPGAIDLYRDAIASNSKDANAHYNLGLLLRGQGQTEEGNKEVQAGVNLDATLRPKAIAEGVPLTGS
jgi:Tfp pilus assembly protein PilF